MQAKKSHVFPKLSVFESLRKKLRNIVAITLSILVLSCVVMFLSYSHWLSVGASKGKLGDMKSEIRAEKSILRNIKKLLLLPVIPTSSLLDRMRLTRALKSTAQANSLNVVRIAASAEIKKTNKKKREMTSKKNPLPPAYDLFTRISLAANDEMLQGEVEPITAKFQGSFYHLASFLQAMSKSFPGLFWRDMLAIPIDETTLELQLTGYFMPPLRRPGQSKPWEPGPAAPLNLAPESSPFIVPTIHADARDDKEPVLDQYINYMRRHLLIRSSSEKNAAKKMHFIQSIIRNGTKVEAQIAGKRYVVGERIGQLKITDIQHHSVTLEDAFGVLTLNMSGLNSFRSKLQ